MSKQSGFLDVQGKGDADVIIRHQPRDIEVVFLDDETTIPCNPIRHDKLEFELHLNRHGHHGYTLLIKWEVSSVRKIKWTVVS